MPKDARDSKLCILHVCGDDPQITYFDWVLGKYSPRMWR